VKSRERYQGLASLVRARLGGATRRDVVFTVGSSAATLVSNFAAGILLARTLGADGRGATAAITAAPMVLAWMIALGSAQTIAYFQAKHPEKGGQLLSTWLVLTIPLGGLAVGAGEALLPTLFSAQSSPTVELGQRFMLLAPLIILNETLLGLILGDRRFIFYNVLRVGAPTLLAIAYIGLVTVHKLTVSTAVWSVAGMQLTSVIVLLAASVHRHGLDRPSLSLARASLWYGIRAHGVNMGSYVNARLDLLIMPAFLSSAHVGLYSVATNVSWIVFALSGSLWALALPLATHRGPTDPETVGKFLRTTMAIGVVVAAGLAALAPVALPLVYGSEFVDATTALRILLPGSVLFAGAVILVSGLLSMNRPLLATVTQGVGAVVTIAGLVIFLRSGGIIAAAIISSVAYATVLVVALIAYMRITGVGWRDVLIGSRQPKDPTAQIVEQS
jgi:O-antigen/teichoic acid export membrane protein